MAGTSTPTYYWLLESNCKLFRLTSTRYATEEEVREACYLAPSVIVTPLEQTRVDIEEYKSPVRDSLETGRRIRHSGGSAGEGAYGRAL